MICEAKNLNQSLTDAYLQAVQYVHQHKLTNYQRIVTTDEKRLILYLKGSFLDWLADLEPFGYVNLTMIRKQNVFPHGTSGIKTLIELFPWNAMR